MSQGENDYEEALQRLALTIGEKIGEGAQKTKFLFSSTCIYRVPEELRKLKESAYTPHLIAIGPLHRYDNHLQTPMQHVKMSYADHLLRRLTAGMEDPELAEQKKFTVLKECVAAVKTSIGDAKKCYAEEVTVDEEMMLVDGCFILEVLYRFYLRSMNKEEEKEPINGEDNGNLEGQETEDPIFGHTFTANTVQNDLLLLENQIPFLVLEKLFPLTVDRIPIGPNRPGEFSLTDHVRFYFGKKMSPNGNSTNSCSTKTWCSPSDCLLRVFCNKMENTTPEDDQVLSGNGRNAKYYHILHQIHDGYLPRDQTKKKEPSDQPMPSASDLVYAGVKFVPDVGNDLFKVKFTEPEGPFWWCHRARFEIPTIGIYDSTESFLRNLIAFEQCCPGVSQHFTSYAILMDMLVNTDKDVQVLEKAGVVHNHLGASEDATDLFNKLCKEVVKGEFFFADTCDNATKYSKHSWPKNLAYLRRQYFASPWKFIALCLAFSAVGMTITQFIYGFFH